MRSEILLPSRWLRALKACALFGVALALLTPAAQAASPWDGEWEGQLTQQRMACSPCKVRLSVRDGIPNIRGDVSIPRFDIDGAGQVSGSVSLSSVDFSAECSLKGRISGNTLSASGRCVGNVDAPQLTLRRVSANTAGAPPSDTGTGRVRGGNGPGVPPVAGTPGSQERSIRGTVRDGSDPNSRPRDLGNAPAGGGSPIRDSNGDSAPLQLAAVPTLRGGIVTNMKGILPAIVEIHLKTGLGSGFVVDAAAGLIITNAHVVVNVTSVTVVFADGDEVPGTVLRRDRQRDVALIQVRKKGLRAVAIRPGEVTLAEKVYAIGSPLGLSQTVSEGIISSYRKLNGGMNLIQATAAISHGNSGGPLCDANGNVIGISTGFLSGGQNLNFFIPIDSALMVLNIKLAGR